MSCHVENSSDIKAPLYKPESWMAKVKLIHQLSLETNTLFVVTGDTNSGKTSFSKIMKTSITDIRTVILNGSELDHENVIEIMAKCLGFDDAHTLEDLLTAIEQSKKHFLIIIDDAEDLSDDVIKKQQMLMTHQVAATFLNFCLIGTNQLREKIQKIQQECSAFVIEYMDLNAFTEKETQEYIMFRLMNHPEHMNKDKLAQFYQLTQGHIDNINKHMEHFFNLGRNASSAKNTSVLKHSKTSKTVLYSLLTAGFAFAVGVGIAISTSDSDVSELHEIVEIEMPVQNSSRDIAIDAPLMLSSIPSYDLTASHQNLQLKKQHVDSQQLSSYFDAHTRESTKKIGSSALIASQTSHNNTHKVQNTLPVSASKAGNKNHYAIQIMAAKNLEDLKKFAQKNGIYFESHFAKVHNKDKSWYVLMLGDYSDHLQAKKAIHVLPNNLSQFKPWIRSQKNLNPVG